MTGEKRGEIRKSNKLDRISYELRGPIADKASKMAREGIKILALNTGNPPAFGFRAPQAIIDAMTSSMLSAEAYSDSRGIPGAIEAIRKYEESKGIPNLAYEDIYTGNGVSEMISVAVQALIEDGDEILIPMPDYPLWTSVSRLSGAKVVHYVCDEQAEWNPDLDDIKKKVGPRTKAIVIINPNNPTGANYSKQVLLDILEVARENNLLVFSDEIYDRLVMDDLPHYSAAALAPDLPVITFNGLSKSHMIPGFRCGWMCLSGDKSSAKSYIEGVHMLASMRLCANVPAQSVIEAGLADPYNCKQYTVPGGRIYEQREAICKAIDEIPGLSVVRPKAAFYMFPKIDAEKFHITSDEKFVLDFLNEHHVLLTQGKGFNWPTPDHFRIVYLPEAAELTAMGQHLKSFLATYSQED
ncbi:MAG: pyridoxal phosphate-dependent aminotransferase [Clostridiales Family XIII bacterium]|jgi:alanine-synthesizing transaminase|nr:pyridoxal phosphate-dependent aminotransferase [Clostridiales Family XIII bacterium]